MVTRMTRARRETPHDCTCTCPGQHTRAGLAKHVALASHPTSWGSHVSKYIIGKWEKASKLYFRLSRFRFREKPLSPCSARDQNKLISECVCVCVSVLSFLGFFFEHRQAVKSISTPLSPTSLPEFLFTLSAFPLCCHLGRKNAAVTCPSQEHTNYNAHAEVGNAFDMPRWCKLGPKCA